MAYIETDRKEALKEVRRAHPAYSSIAEEFWSDRKFVEAAIKAHGEAYKHASQELRMESAIISMAIEKMKDYRCHLTFADFPDEVRDNVDWVRQAMKAESHAFSQASDAIKDNKDFAFEVIKESGWNYGALSDRLKNDKDIALVAARTTYIYGRHIPEALKNDKDIILAATAGGRLSEEEAKALPEFVWSDKDLLIDMTANGTTRHINRISPELFSDRQFLEEMLISSKDHWDASDLMNRASGEIKADKDFALFAVGQHSSAYSYLPYDLQVDRDVARATLENDIEYIQYTKYVLESEIDKDLAMAIANKSTELFETNAMKNCRADEDVALVAVLKDEKAYNALPEHLQKNEGIALATLSHSGRSFSSRPYSVEYVEKHAPELMENKEFMMEAVKINGLALNVYNKNNPLLQDREFMLSVQPYIIDNYSCQAFENDKEFILEAVKARPEAIQLATNSLRFDKEFINQAVANNEEVKKFCEPKMVRPDISYFKAKMEPKKEEVKKEPQTLADVIAAAKKVVVERNADKGENTGRDDRDAR